VTSGFGFFTACLRDFGRELLVLRLAAVAAGLFFFLAGMSGNHSTVCGSSSFGFWVMCDEKAPQIFFHKLLPFFNNSVKKNVENH
jgi:hypothetical protein